MAIISSHENVIKSYAELDQDANRLANAVKDGTDLVKGDVVGLWTSNSYNSVLIQYACAKLGLILCTINPSYKSQELEYVLQKAKVKALFLPGAKSPQSAVNQFTDIMNSTNFDRSLLKQLIVIDGQVQSTPDLETLSLNDMLRAGSEEFDTESYKSLVADDPAIIM